jgi:hypothetical protein
VQRVLTAPLDWPLEYEVALWIAAMTEQKPENNRFLQVIAGKADNATPRVGCPVMISPAKQNEELLTVSIRPVCTAIQTA